jgi:hypothetical protein
VTFRYADNQDPDAQGRDKCKLLPLAVADFLQRWLWHVPPPGLQVGRSYGLYAPAKWAALAQCRQVLGQAPLEPPPALDWQTSCAQQGAQHPECCLVCGQQLIRTATLPPVPNTRRLLLGPQPGAPLGPVPELREAV